MSDASVEADVLTGMTLIGAPRSVIVDEGAMGDPGSADRHHVAALLALLGLDVVTIPLGTATLALPAVAIVSQHHDLPECYCWYVGAGKAPPGMHATLGAHAASSIFLLELLGTGFAQQRAGAAFRAAGSGLAPPTSTPYDAPEMLAGISRRAAPIPRTPGVALSRPARQAPEIAKFLGASLDAIESCCAPSGAIAAAPPARAGEADYWYFWQRDAAHVAVALSRLSSADPASELSRRAATAVGGYLAFVELLSAMLEDTPERTTFSRCHVNGAPVDGYGDPQPDGAAATALAVLTIDTDAAHALAVAGPFLDPIAAGACRKPSFDLWELSVGYSYYAANLGLRALRLAVDLFRRVGHQPPQRYLAEITRLQDFRRLFGAADAPVRSRPQSSEPGWFDLLSGLDASTVASELLAADSSEPPDTGVAATMLGLQQHYRDCWPINVAWQATGQPGGGIGRFPADCNDGYGSTGGNPWPICTLWAARHHLRAAMVSPDLSARSRTANLGHGYLNFVLAHCDPSAISEQIDADTGAPRGVRVLAWSHAEMIQTLLASQLLGQPAGGP